MRALRSLEVGARSAFNGFRWPTPAGGVPGAWVRAGVDAPALEVRGFVSAELPWWLEDELWEIELHGEVRREGRALHAGQARLVRRVEAWTAEVADELTAACAARVRERVVAALRREGRMVEADTVAGAAKAGIEASARALAGTAGAALVAGLLADVLFYARDAGGGARGAGTAAYIAAYAAGGGDMEGPGYKAGFESERRWQVDWLVRRLELA